jgi:hypothetical protein
LLDFNTLSAKLPPPFNLSFPLLQYWDGQPVTYVCKRRAPPGSKDQSEGEVYFAVAFEIVDEDARRKLAEKEGVTIEKDDGESHAGGQKKSTGIDLPLDFVALVLTPL